MNVWRKIASIALISSPLWGQAINALIAATVSKETIKREPPVKSVVIFAAYAATLILLAIFAAVE